MCLLLFTAVLSYFASLSPVATQPQLAVINPVVSTSEDGPRVSGDYRFAPGDYLYFTFEIANFAIQSDAQADARKISLRYEVVPQDMEGRPLVEAQKGEIQTTLSAEDKHWVPKRRASFLLPSFVAAGPFRVHIDAQDLLAKTAVSLDVPFAIGGVQVTPASSITIQNFAFLRRASDSAPLQLAAYSPGDSVFARFLMTGFVTAPDHHCRLSYGVTVLDPNGKPFIQNPTAVNIDQGGFYPPQFVTGDIALQLTKNTERGAYIIIVEARDLIAHKTYELRQSFSIE